MKSSELEHADRARPLTSAIYSSSGAGHLSTSQFGNTGLDQSHRSPHQDYRASAERDSRYKTSSPIRYSATKAHDESRYSPSRYNPDKLNPSLIFLLRECFKEWFAIERSVEDLKRELALKQDFTLAGAFNLFSGYSHSKITNSDFTFGLERLGIVCDATDGSLVVGRYDADSDGRLGFWEFSNMFTPIDSMLRADLERKQAIWEMSPATKELFKRCLRRIVDAEAMVEAIRQRAER